MAIPAVVAFNAFQRWLRALITRAEAVGHALASNLERDEVRAAARARLCPPPRAEHEAHGVRHPEPHGSKGAA